VSQKIVIISNYYPPEMGAAANRIKNLAEGLEQKGNDVTIICPLPNYPEGKIFKKYKGRFSINETTNSVYVKRYWIFPTKSKVAIVRLINMISFSWSLWFSIFSFLRKKPDVFIINSPPLLVAFSGLLLSKLLRCKTILNVSDIWPLSALELGVIKKGLFYSLLERIEKVNYRLADKIIGQSEEIIKHISEIVDKEYLVYRNVPKFKEYKPNEKSTSNLKIVYAGLLGYAQAISKICSEINFRELNVEFHIYGAGMEEEKIKVYAENKNSNIFFHGNKNSKEIKNEIIKYDLAIVPLKNRILGAVPSKIFELMQLGIPILYTCKGEASEIILKNNLGLLSSSLEANSLEEIIKKFKNMSSEDFQKMSENGLNLHRSEYRLDYQLTNINTFIKSNHV